MYKPYNISMYHHQAVEYSVDYNRDNQLSFIFGELQHGLFEQKEQGSEKHEIPTSHKNKSTDPQKLGLQNDEPSESEGQNEQQKGQESYQTIELSIAKLFKIQKSKKGRQKQTKNIYHIFKNQTVSYLAILCHLKILCEQDRARVQQFKQESPSVPSFRKLLLNQRIKQKVTQFYYSTQSIKRFLESDRLEFFRKIEIIKNFHLMLNILTQNNQFQERAQSQ